MRNNRWPSGDSESRRAVETVWKSLRSNSPVFSANLEEPSLVFVLLTAVLPFVLDRPLSPVYPGFEDTKQQFGRP
jgi:hypothetical protein